MSERGVLDVPISDILSGGQNLGMLGQSENSSEWVIIVIGSAPLSDKGNDRGCTLTVGNQDCRQPISTVEICFAKYILYKSIYIMVSKRFAKGFNSRDPYEQRVQHCSLQSRERSSLVRQCMIIMG